LNLPQQTTWTFEVKLSAYNGTDSVGAGWIFRGVMRFNSTDYDTVLVGSLITESWKETAMNSTDATIVTGAPDGNGLEIQVTGLAGKTINWVAVVDICQVSYAGGGGEGGE
jgi:hypothetical protein